MISGLEVFIEPTVLYCDTITGGKDLTKTMSRDGITQYRMKVWLVTTLHNVYGTTAIHSRSHYMPFNWLFRGNDSAAQIMTPTLWSEWYLYEVHARVFTPHTTFHATDIQILNNSLLTSIPLGYFSNESWYFLLIYQNESHCYDFSVTVSLLLIMSRK